MSAQYDNIGEKYDPVKKLPIIKYGETYTITHLMGDIQGKTVIDLACGSGFYTRRIKSQGADRVVGVDVSTEMANLAKQQEAENPLGIEYVVSNVTELQLEEQFDVAIAAYLLNYAATEAEMLTMLQKVYDHLVEGGRFITCTFHPAYIPDKGDITKYGFSIDYPKGIDNSDCCKTSTLTFHLEQPFSFDTYQWCQKIYDKLLPQVGFKEVFWQPTLLDPQGIIEFGEDFWRDYLDNNPIAMFSCVK